MAKRASSKINKSIALRDIADQRAEFLRLSDLIDELVPNPSQPPWRQLTEYELLKLKSLKQWSPRWSQGEDVAPSPSSSERRESTAKMDNYCKRVLSTFGPTVKLLDRLILADDALKFDNKFEGVRRKYGSWTNSSDDANTNYNVSMEIKKASIAQLDAFKQTIEDTWDDSSPPISSFASIINISGDNYHIHDIINSPMTGVAIGPHSKAVAEASLDAIKRREQRVIDHHDTVVARLKDAGQLGLAQAISLLTVAELAGPNLTDADKESRVKQLSIIGEDVLKGIRSNANMG